MTASRATEGVWERFRDRFITKTSDSIEYAWSYPGGMLTMEKDRIYADINQRVIDLKAEANAKSEICLESVFYSTTVHPL